MNAVTDFKSIKRKLDRMEQKAEYDAKNPEPAPSMYGWPYGLAVPYGVPEMDSLDIKPFDARANLHEVLAGLRAEMDSWELVEADTL